MSGEGMLGACSSKCLSRFHRATPSCIRCQFMFKRLGLLISTAGWSSSCQPGGLAPAIMAPSVLTGLNHRTLSPCCLTLQSLFLLKVAAQLRFRSCCNAINRVSKTFVVCIGELRARLAWPMPCNDDDDDESAMYNLLWVSRRSHSSQGLK